MAKHPIVQDLEARFRQRLEEQAKAIRGEFPGLEVEVWSWGTPTGWHNIGIDCSIADTPLDRPNNVSLIIEITDLMTEPKLCDAMVVWGHPSGTIEAELFDERLPYNESTIAIVDERLDELVAALREALRRGAPSDWPAE